MATLNQSARQQTSIFPYIDELEKYQIIKKIGGGTYGNVYKAQCKTTNKFFALKHILIRKEDDGFPPSALSEIIILQDLIYENIVQLFGICRSPRGTNSMRSDFYLIFELCDGDLAGIIKNNRINFTLEHIKCIMNQILDGLYFLHNNKIVHRDLKPANILITKNGILKLADFGLSKVMKPREDNRENQDTNQYVSLWYRAPELLLGDQNYGMEIDMWSIGCIFAELWTRIPIIRGKGEKHQLELIQKIRGSIEWPGVHDLPYYPKFKSSPSKDLQVQNNTTNYKTGIQEPFAVDFIDALLTLDPKQRININRAVDSIFLRSKPLSNALELLFSNYFSISESNEASHNTTQHDQNVPQRRNMPNVPHEAIY